MIILVIIVVWGCCAFRMKKKYYHMSLNTLYNMNTPEYLIICPSSTEQIVQVAEDNITTPDNFTSCSSPTEQIVPQSSKVADDINTTPDILISCSGPIDEWDTTFYIPKSFTQVASLLECTHDGKIYFDDYTEFGLEVPKGAIPLEMTVSIDIGVTLYGPLQYPKGLRPVSPIFWVCVRDQKDFKFLKPVKVTIPHFLNLKHRDNLGLTFLKAEHEMNSHQMYQFDLAEGNTTFDPFTSFGILETTHFCSLCIASEDSIDTIRNANFCISAVVPRKVPVERSAHVYFFLTFLLKTCIITLKNQMNKFNIEGELEEPEYFQFKGDNNQLDMICPKNQEHWIFGISGKPMVCVYIKLMT